MKMFSKRTPAACIGLAEKLKKTWNSLYLEDPLPFVAGSFNIKRINFDFSKGVFWECIETTFMRQ